MRAALAACALASGLACASPGEPDPAARRETDEALAILAKMSELLASRPAVQLEADLQYDAVQPSGERIEFGSTRQIALRRPDRARVEVVHRDGERELVTFDGRRLSAALPDHRLYASADFEGTIGEAFDLLVTEHGAPAPLADLFRPDLSQELARRVISARRLPPVSLGGFPCHHLAFRGERIDFQIFIQRGETPLPRRLLIDYHQAEGRPQFRAQLRDWDLSPDLPDSFFRFVAQPGARRVGFPDLLDRVLGPPHDEGSTR